MDHNIIRCICDQVPSGQNIVVPQGSCSSDNSTENYRSNTRVTFLGNLAECNAWQPPSSSTLGSNLSERNTRTNQPVPKSLVNLTMRINSKDLCTLKCNSSERKERNGPAPLNSSLNSSKASNDSNRSSKFNTPERNAKPDPAKFKSGSTKPNTKKDISTSKPKMNSTGRNEESASVSTKSKSKSKKTNAKGNPVSMKSNARAKQASPKLKSNSTEGKTWSDPTLSKSKYNLNQKNAKDNECPLTFECNLIGQSTSLAAERQRIGNIRFIGLPPEINRLIMNCEVSRMLNNEKQKVTDSGSTIQSNASGSSSNRKRKQSHKKVNSAKSKSTENIKKSELTYSRDKFEPRRKIKPGRIENPSDFYLGKQGNKKSKQSKYKKDQKSKSPSPKKKVPFWKKMKVLKGLRKLPARVSTAALKYVATERIVQLATPVERYEKKHCRAIPIKIGRKTLTYEPTARILRLAEPKIREGFQHCLALPLKVSKKALKYRPSERILRLSTPKLREENPNTPSSEEEMNLSPGELKFRKESSNPQRLSKPMKRTSSPSIKRQSSPKLRRESLNVDTQTSTDIMLHEISIRVKKLEPESGNADD